MKTKDIYEDPKIFEFPNMTVRVHIPILSDEERAARMKKIHKTAEALMKTRM